MVVVVFSPLIWRGSDYWKKITLLAFGHLGDGNLHLIFEVNWKEDKKTTYDVVYKHVGIYGRSISTEQGIGVQNGIICINPGAMKK